GTSMKRKPAACVRVVVRQRAMATRNVEACISGSPDYGLCHVLLGRACRVTGVVDLGQRFQPNEHQVLALGWKAAVLSDMSGVCTRPSPQEHIMKEQDHCMPGLCLETSEYGELVAIAVNPNHPLLQLKRALPWEALCEVMTRHWRQAGKNTDGHPGLPWD